MIPTERLSQGHIGEDQSCYLCARRVAQYCLQHHRGPGHQRLPGMGHAAIWPGSKAGKAEQAP